MFDFLTKSVSEYQFGNKEIYILQSKIPYQQLAAVTENNSMDICRHTQE